MIKILFFIDDLAGGGAEKVLRTLVNNLDRQKFSVTVQTINEADPAKYLASGIRYRAINRCRTKLGRKLFSYWIRLCAELKWLYPLYMKDDYDIEVAYLECGPTKILAGSTNKKAVKLAWVHCDLAKKEGIVQQAEKLKEYYRAYNKVICVSQTVQSSYENMMGKDTEMVVLHNVNDETAIMEKAGAFVPEKDNCPVIVTVGRLSHEKGVDRLLEACRLLKEAQYEFKLMLIGDGPERSKLSKSVSAYGLDGQVVFLGYQDNPYPYMVAADVIAVPSRFEGFSTVVTEALILGKPVVTTPCSGMKELLGDSEYGLITEDSVDGIYAGIKQLLEDPQLRKQYADAARRRGMAFSKAATVKETEDFFLNQVKRN